jgi:hypothetical protein
MFNVPTTWLFNVIGLAKKDQVVAGVMRESVLIRRAAS